MATVFLHVGQAGNEVGAAFWKLAAAEKPAHKWLFDERGRCRCVLIDTEPKVVRGVAHTIGADRLAPHCALVDQSGRGNNWAMGYHGPAAGSPNAVAEAALEALRWQWERCDWCSGVLMSHSLGGGTGSGTGSFLMQELRDRHPRHYLSALSIAPFAAGELPLSAYNASLSLSYLQEFADAVFLFDNATLMRQLQAAAAASSATAASAPRRPSVRLCMSHLDQYLGRALAGLAMPTNGPNGRLRPMDFGELVSGVCPMPSLKMLQLVTSSAPPTSTPQPSASASARRPPSWGTLVEQCVDRLSRYDLRQRPVVSLASQAVARGLAGEPPDERAQGRLHQLLGASPCTPFPVDWKLSNSTATALPASAAARTLTVVSNRSIAGPQIEQLLLRAQLQLSVKAYVHHYEKYGVATDEIAERLEDVRQVVDAYAELGMCAQRGRGGVGGMQCSTGEEHPADRRHVGRC